MASLDPAFTDLIPSLRDDLDITEEHGEEVTMEDLAKGVRRRCRKGDAESKDRRVLQNRAAQRAFRQRKEKYVKDLEEKVALLMEKVREQEQERSSDKTEMGCGAPPNSLIKVEITPEIKIVEIPRPPQRDQSTMTDPEFNRYDEKDDSARETDEDRRHASYSGSIYQEHRYQHEYYIHREPAGY
ncbi:hypothetical protein HK101_004479, partial [Irineochytrium annulatum]